MRRPSNRILPSEITSEAAYFNRRTLLAAGLAGAAMGVLPQARANAPAPDPRFTAPRNSKLSITDPPNSWE